MDDLNVLLLSFQSSCSWWHWNLNEVTMRLTLPASRGNRLSFTVHGHFNEKIISGWFSIAFFLPWTRKAPRHECHHSKSNWPRLRIKYPSDHVVTELAWNRAGSYATCVEHLAHSQSSTIALIYYVGLLHVTLCPCINATFRIRNARNGSVLQTVAQYATRAAQPLGIQAFEHPLHGGDQGCLG